MSIKQIESAYIKIKGWKRDSLDSGRIATGIEAQFILSFTPEQYVDYSCELLCETDREQFIVPVNAIGARGTLLNLIQLFSNEVSIT